MIKLTRLYGIARKPFFIGSWEMVKGKFFYAVKIGARPGVYNTWDECKTQVSKFPCATYKKFALEEDAWAFVRSKSAAESSASATEGGSCVPGPPRFAPEGIPLFPLGKKRPPGDCDEVDHGKRLKCTDEDPLKACSEDVGNDRFTYMGDAVVVYTDGCCTGNGRAGARAGIGVYWGPDHPMNVSDRLEGRQTNQRAEIQAACKALEQAKDKNFKKLVLYTDSMFTINDALLHTRGVIGLAEQLVAPPVTLTSDHQWPASQVWPERCGCREAGQGSILYNVDREQNGNRDLDGYQEQDGDREGDGPQPNKGRLVSTVPPSIRRNHQSSARPSVQSLPLHSRCQAMQRTPDILTKWLHGESSVPLFRDSDCGSRPHHPSPPPLSLGMGVMRALSSMNQALTFHLSRCTTLCVFQ
ncbi:hypothetical protein JZ751_004918, partial [Albula glossodonta]